METPSRRLEGLSPVSVATVMTVLWLVLALALDRLLLAPLAPGLTQAVALGIAVKLHAGELVYPPVSLLLLLVVPMLILALYLVPWREPRAPEAWHAAFVIWAQPWFWLVVAVLLTVSCESLFLLVADVLPPDLKALFTKFSVVVELRMALPGFEAHTPVTLRAGLVGFLGFAWGVYLFLARGLGEALK